MGLYTQYMRSKEAWCVGGNCEGGPGTQFTHVPTTTTLHCADSLHLLWSVMKLQRRSKKGSRSSLAPTVVFDEDSVVAMLMRMVRVASCFLRAQKGHNAAHFLRSSMVCWFGCCAMRAFVLHCCCVVFELSFLSWHDAFCVLVLFFFQPAVFATVHN
jgi:hypothetical protein